MKKQDEIEETPFQARFRHFLAVYELNTNSLAVQLCPNGTEKEIKNKRVNIGRWASGKVSPSYEGIVEIASKYNIDMNWLMLGRGKMDGSPSDNELGDGIDWKAKYENEHEVNKLLRSNQQMSVIIMENAGLLTDREGSKIESNGQTTDYIEARPTRIGYVQEYMLKLSEEQIKKASAMLEGMEAYCHRLLEGSRGVLSV